MLFKNFFPKAVSLLFVEVLDTNSDLAVSVSEQASIIDIGRSNNNFFIIDNHKFAVNINDLSDWNLIEHTAFTKPKKVNILVDLITGKSYIH